MYPLPHPVELPRTRRRDASDVSTSSRRGTTRASLGPATHRWLRLQVICQTGGGTSPCAPTVGAFTWSDRDAFARTQFVGQIFSTTSSTCGRFSDAALPCFGEVERLHGSHPHRWNFLRRVQRNGDPLSRHLSQRSQERGLEVRRRRGPTACPVVPAVCQGVVTRDAVSATASVTAVAHSRRNWRRRRTALG
jgi:hypothetical protein